LCIYLCVKKNSYVYIGRPIIFCKLFVVFGIKNNNFLKTRTKEITSWVTIKSLSLRRFAVLLKLCKEDNQPRRLQDKIARSKNDWLLHCNDRRNTFLNDSTKSLEIDTTISILTDTTISVSNQWNTNRK
jgi:hypothetical protein